ncbi:hypothetical protein GW819_00290 [Candidatus Gracilibacteria bacterium]|nr:hypothetical protein [Candidatus Gracilibacteria bacterium]OIO76586.1 MAG: hypothetical protein AUJ87_02400 [Candidatus Gracilibacteria bacterium CG1_02_38_174]PIQ10768.1 MAG: hypothetical protein COW68_03775 [Candidatus Gracilibacteria bacterium CG18_big_fil_WC_8_21_14_2_50_38_16]PIQ42040.1 MAG: hypothetical protein COW06_00850 [Candidatus Gracilibacteria bacterium CG12_big_fil_rev_8_21_14_0_65_38_15]PIZ01904.1 MAG: hypothetical protein COY60_01275 [Candidatus Gracilibacteria bacterium CG_4
MIASSERYAKKSKESALKPIRSTVMFQGKYKEELQKTMDIVEKAIEDESGKHFIVDSILGGNNNLKVRIDDQEQGVERIVNCMFRHHHTDERYGNIKIELVTTGLKIKSKLHIVGKFHILDRDVIKEKILKDILICVKEIR